VKTTTVGVLGSLAVNLMLAVAVAAVFSSAPVAQAREVAQCTHADSTPAPAPAEHARAGGHLAAVRMGWEAS
jgi:hypothetical protein